MRRTARGRLESIALPQIEIVKNLDIDAQTLRKDPADDIGRLFMVHLKICIRQPSGMGKGTSRVVSVDRMLLQFLTLNWRQALEFFPHQLAHTLTNRRLTSEF
jgi:hypothetical protein